MQPLHTNDLVRLAKIMNDMRDCATASDWNKLARLDNERRAILEFSPADLVGTRAHSALSNQSTEYLTHAYAKGNSDSTAESKRDFLIDEIRSLDQQILDVVQSGRQRLLNENRGLSAQTKAKELYAKTNSIT